MKRVLAVMLIVGFLAGISIISEGLADDGAGRGTDWPTHPLQKNGDWFTLRHAMAIDSGAAEGCTTNGDVYDSLYDTLQTHWVYIGPGKCELLMLFDLTSTIAAFDSVDSFIVTIQTRVDTSGTTGIYDIHQFHAGDTISAGYLQPKDSLVVDPIGSWIRLRATYYAVWDSVQSAPADTLAPFYGAEVCSLQFRFRPFKE